MKKYYKIFFSILTCLIIISCSVLVSFAAIPYQSDLQGLEAFNVYCLPSNSPVFYTATITDSCYVSLGNVTAINLSAVLQLMIDEADFPSDCTGFTFVFGSSRATPLASDMFVVSQSPGFASSITATGVSVMTGANVTITEEVALSFPFRNFTYYLFNSSSSSASQQPFIKDISSFRVTFTAVADENNGYQAFTAENFARSGILLTVGRSFYSFADALNSANYADGYRVGYQNGTKNVTQRVHDAFEEGKQALRDSQEWQDRYDDGVAAGREEVNQDEYWRGYGDGVDDAEGFNLSMIPEAYLGTAYTYITSLFDFDLFGWNLLGILGSIMVIIVIGFIIRKVV